MAKLPVVSGENLAKALAHFGYKLDHQTGSYIILRQREKPFRRLTISTPQNNSQGTLRSIIRQAGLTVEDLLKALKG